MLTHCGALRRGTGSALICLTSFGEHFSLTAASVMIAFSAVQRLANVADEVQGIL
jgi:hypothetical protein